ADVRRVGVAGEPAGSGGVEARHRTDSGRSAQRRGESSGSKATAPATMMNLASRIAPRQATHLITRQMKDLLPS
ncbi:MAG: hypothetical protein AB1Z55_02555, partial [Acidimicrobiia bacterium]